MYRDAPYSYRAFHARIGNPSFDHGSWPILGNPCIRESDAPWAGSGMESLRIRGIPMHAERLHAYWDPLTHPTLAHVWDFVVHGEYPSTWKEDAMYKKYRGCIKISSVYGCGWIVRRREPKTKRSRPATSDASPDCPARKWRAPAIAPLRIPRRVEGTASFRKRLFIEKQNVPARAPWGEGRARGGDGLPVDRHTPCRAVCCPRVGRQRTPEELCSRGRPADRRTDSCLSAIALASGQGGN